MPRALGLIRSGGLMGVRGARWQAYLLAAVSCVGLGWYRIGLSQFFGELV